MKERLLKSKLLEELRQRKITWEESGREVYDLSMINPDIPPHSSMVDRLVEASLNPGNHRYAVARGFRKLREAFCEKYRGRFGVEADAENEVCVTLGAKDATLNLLRILADERKRLVLIGPTYPAYLSAGRLCGYEITTVPLKRCEDSLLSELENVLRSGAKHNAVLLLNFPHNPTGFAVGEEFYQKLSRVREETGTFLINDFVYGELSHTDVDQPPSILSQSESFSGMAEIYSLSKAYSVPGWRVGAVIGDRKIVGELARLKAEIDYGNFLPIQIASSFALRADRSLSEQAASRYSERAEALRSELRGTGFEPWKPAAGASLWGKLPFGPEVDSARFCCLLLEQHGVLVLPGVLFGPEWEHYIRFALVHPAERLSHVAKAVGSLIENLSDAGEERIAV